MSFSFSAQGAKDECVASLEAFTAAHLGGTTDHLGGDVRDMLVAYLRNSAEAPAGQRFSVSAYGHAGSDAYESVLTLSVAVKLEPVPEGQETAAAWTSKPTVQQEAAGVQAGTQVSASTPSAPLLA